MERKPEKKKNRVRKRTKRNVSSGGAKKQGQRLVYSASTNKEGNAGQPEPVRLNRYIAQSGVCSRRKADELIREKRVKVNGQVIGELGVRVSSGDIVEVNGERISPLQFEYVLLNKPTNTITTNKDEKDRKIVLDLIDDDSLKRSGVFPVGRLDRNTQGVLLITNDGELAHRLMHPSYNVEKLYVVRTERPVLPHEMEKMVEGIHIEGDTYKADKVDYISLPAKSELGIRLHEGKNRHIRRMMEALGHKTVFLERVRYAGLTSKGIRRGKWRRLAPVEIKRLRRLVKLT